MGRPLTFCAAIAFLQLISKSPVSTLSSISFFPVFVTFRETFQRLEIVIFEN